MKKFLLLLTLLPALAGAPAEAGTVTFRAGEVLAAELSSSKPKVANEERYPVKIPFRRPLYALVTVLPAPGRTLSVYDYALEAYGNTYPCLALRRGDEPFDAANREFTRLGKEERFGLLFVVDASAVGLNPTEELQLRALYAKGKNAAVPLIFENLKAAPFSEAKTIPAAGKFKVDD